MFFFLIVADLLLLGTLLLPLLGTFPSVTIALIGIVLCIALCGIIRCAGTSHWDAVAARCLRVRAIKGLLGAAFVSLSFFALTEFVARTLTNLGLLAYYRPIITARSGVEQTDWRAFHITSDTYREADPVLFWRPVKRYPFNSLGFKGREVRTSTGPHPFRIMCYGDSNTDGPDRGGWPEKLQELFDGDRAPEAINVQVINAGCAGYSSYQGMRRFMQEVSLYSPDLVMVSFGWNDNWAGLGAPDKYYASRFPMINALHAVLYRYRFYLCLKQCVSTNLFHRKPYSGPRVALEDYRSNLSLIADVAREHGATVILLTRPYCGKKTSFPAVFFGKVDRCNESLLKLAAQKNIPAMDIARFFTSLCPGMFADECHFNLEGHKRMAAYVHDYLLNTRLCHRRRNS